MRIALTACTSDEVDRVRGRLGHDCSVADTEELQGGVFDAVVIGTGRDRIAVLEQARKEGLARILLLETAGDYDVCGDGIAALAPGDLDALPHLVRREIRIHGERARATRYEEAMRETPGTTWIWSRCQGLLVLRGRFAELTGYTLDEIGAVDIEMWVSRVHPADIGTLVRRWKQLATTNDRTFEVEHRFLRKDGSWVWLHQHIALLSTDEHEPFVIGTTRDVTGEHQAEEALRKSELRYRTLVEQAGDIIFSLDGDGRFTSLNKAFEELTGWPRVEWIGRMFTDVIEPSSVEAALERLRASRNGAAGGYSEYRMKTKSGRSITVEVTVQTFEIDGQMYDTMGIARDITQRKETEARAAKEKRLTSLGQLATQVAHEFNNVLMSIMPFAELLQRRSPNDERLRTATGHIIQAVRRGRDISQEVLRFARPGKAMIAPVVVRQWLDEFALRVQALIGPSCNLEVEIADRDLTINADRALLDQVATNIVVNAREAMSDGGTLTIAAGRGTADGTVDLEFRDTGCGISETVLEHVFEPLFTTKRSGTGLGLSIAYQAMRQQHGSILVRSRVGQGSTFTLSFPAAAAAPAAPLRLSQAKRRILIVEDDEGVGAGLSAVLADEGFDVRLVACGLDSKQSIEEFGPDLVLLDVNLPDISGIDVYEQIRETWPTLNVIFSTGHADAQALEKVRQRPAPSIMKPYDVSELMAVIATLPVQ